MNIPSGGLLLTAELARDAARGGAVLGGGGGGWETESPTLGELSALAGRPRLVALDDLDDEDTVVTVSAVGAPSAAGAALQPADFVTALDLLREQIGDSVAGLMSSENGGVATLNGWFQSALSGIPVVDAAGNGRAHPTGVMGAMGLDRQPRYEAVQTAVGGAGSRRVCMAVRGALGSTSRLVRQAAVAAGGMVAVARHPVPAGFVREHGAPRAVSLAIELGAGMRERAGDGEAVGGWVAERLGGQLGPVTSVTAVDHRADGGFDAGWVALGEDDRLAYWNEFVLHDRGGERRATFPDLITLLDTGDGRALLTHQVTEGQRVRVLSVDKSRLPLGAGVRHREALRPIEDALDVDLRSYF